MEPTESAAPPSRLRRRRISGVWRRGSALLTAVPSPSGNRVRPAGQHGSWNGRASGSVRAGPANGTGAAGGTGQRIVADSRVSTPLTAHLTAEERVAHLHAHDPARQLSWPALPAAVVAAAGFVLGAGFYRGFTGHSALFPSGTVGWALAVLTGVIVGHLVALGRARWWGGTGSGAALTLSVLLLYGWVPAGMVSLTVVVLVGVARRHRWRQGAPARRGGHPRHRRRGAGARRVRPGPVRRDTVGPADLERLHGARGGADRRSPTSRSPAPCSGICTPRAADCPPSPAPPWSDRAWSRSRCSPSRR